MVVWCCATENTKPRFQPSDDAEYCLYVKLSASAGLTAKTSATAHTDAKFESFVTLVPPVVCTENLDSDVLMMQPARDKFEQRNLRQWPRSDPPDARR